MTQLMPRLLAAFLLSLPLASPSQTAPSHTTPPATKWPIKENVYVIRNFKFGTGESLPELPLHYLTLGSPHHNAAGHVDNAILLLHGTGGNRYTLLNPAFADELFGPVQPLGLRRTIIGQGWRSWKPCVRASRWISRMRSTTRSSVAAISWCISGGSSPSTKFGS